MIKNWFQACLSYSTWRHYTPELILGLCMDDRTAVSKEVKAAAAIALGMLMFHGGGMVQVEPD